MSYDTHRQDDSTAVTTEGTSRELTGPIEQYQQMNTAAEQLARLLNKAVVGPVAKQHFENDRGHPVTQVLPDRTENYDFESHGFNALVLPDERRVVNHSYNGQVISPAGFTRDPEAFTDIIDQAETMWVDTFGEHRRHVTQPGHPGPFPLASEEFTPSIEGIETLYESITESNSLEVVVEAARDGNYPLLAHMFETTEGEILTPGGTDLSAITRSDAIHVPYNDGSIAVLRPTNERTSATTPTRGVIIGHDDTPVGIFAHVTDVTNLDPGQRTTHAAIRDAMGFDRELDPWTDIDRLDAQPGERIRLQGDLRVERTEELDGFTDELARNTRITEYRARLERMLGRVELPSEFVRRRRNDVPVTDVVDLTVSPDGGVTIDPATSDPNLELLAYVTMLCELENGPAQKYTEYADIPYITEPNRAFRSFATVTVDHALEQASEDVHEMLEITAREHRDDVERVARETAAEAQASIDVPQQVNLPVDNHMTFLEKGFAPDVDTEPVPVAVPEETTLHIVHGEHNTVTTQIDPGVYRFSLLPRGLQPPADRPDWPTP